PYPCPSAGGRLVNLPYPAGKPALSGRQAMWSGGGKKNGKVGAWPHWPIIFLRWLGAKIRWQKPACFDVF
ncbi:MAG: hypothetical protein R6V52_05600, partial [Bacteroidales bacterium]